MSAAACPLCGQRNQCARADAQAPMQPCWCFAAQIERRLLERLPADQRNRACLCPGCAQGLPPGTADKPAASAD